MSQDSLGFPRVRYGLVGFARISQGLTRRNKVAQGLTRSHMVRPVQVLPVGRCPVAFVGIRRHQTHSKEGCCQEAHEAGRRAGWLAASIITHICVISIFIFQQAIISLRVGRAGLARPSNRSHRRVAVVVAVAIVFCSVLFCNWDVRLSNIRSDSKIVRVAVSRSTHA